MIKLWWEDFAASGSFLPKKLPRRTPAPVAMELSGDVEAAVGSHPPALTEAAFEIDRHLSVDPTGLTKCGLLTVEIPVLEACAGALVGKGRIDAVVEFAETEPFDVSGRLFAFNRGFRDGKPAILLYARYGPPVNGAVGRDAEISTVHAGRYGTSWSFPFPKLAGGAGWVKAFTLRIYRRFFYNGKRRSYLLASCPDGHLNGRATAVFVDGSAAGGSFVRACAPNG